MGDMPTACASQFLISVTNSTKTDTKYTSAGYGVETIDISKLAAALYIVKVKDKNETLLFQEKLNVIR